MNCYKCATPLPDHSKFCMACGADVSGEGHMHATLSTDADPELMAALQVELGSDYTIERELGRGGMAIVYLGKDNHLGRKVAIKLLPPMLTFGSGPGFIERFKREARTSATLDHPHIIPIYRVSTGGKLFWYVMKFLQGESLDDTLKREGTFETDRAVDIISQVGDALDYAHQNDVVHRDVKPANMMLDKKGWVTVTDFGIAKALNTGTLTGSGAAIGTPHYMAPEQCVGVGVTGASDQYALGVSAYQMFCGDLPFKAESILELMRMHSADPPPPLAERRPDLPRGVVMAVERALAKDPAQRFDSCSDFARELVRWTKDAEQAARRPTAAATVKKTVEEAPRLKAKPVVKPRPDTPVAPKGKEAPASRRWLVIGAVAIVTLLAGGYGLYKAMSKDSPPSSQLAGGAQAAPPQPRVDSGNATGSKAPTGADSTRPALASTATPESTKAAAPPPPVLSRLELRVPKGAAITRNGERVRGVADQDVNPFLFQLPLGRATVFVVTAPGHDSWRRSFTPTVADTQIVTAELKRTVVRVDPPAAKAPDVAPVGTAKITVGSRPSSAISINGKPVSGNPVTDQEVPAGRVTIRFDVIDTSGAWHVDTVVTVKPGDNVSLGRVRLVRKP